jgi:hypothetical protein
MKKHLAISPQKSPRSIENCRDQAAGAIKKKGTTHRAAPPTNRILPKTCYFPFFGTLASSFFPFFFIVKLLSRAAPMDHGRCVQS